MDLATGCYAHACGRFPNNLELMMGLFNCYVCEYSFMKQQQVGLFAGDEHFCVIISFYLSFSYVLLYDRQPSKCTSLPEKKGSYFGQFVLVASSYRYGHRLSSFYLAVWCSVAYSCEDILQVLCDRSGEKLLLLPEGLLKLIASHITVSRLNPLTVCAGANCIQF